MPILHIKDLTKSYGGHAVLARLGLDLEQNEIVAIMGKSGVGKTTLLSCILGFEQLDGGSIELNGRQIDALPIEERQIAYMPQDYGLFPHLSARDNIAFGLMARKEKKEVIEQRVDELLQTVELTHAISRRNVRELSGGEKQRVALARALAIKPRLFLFDEPLSAIDVDTRAEVGASLRTIIKKLSIPAIVITHDPSDAKVIADVVYRMEDGVLVK